MPVMVMSMYHYFCLSHITKNVSTGSESFVLLLQPVDDPFYIVDERRTDVKLTTHADPRPTPAVLSLIISTNLILRE